MIKIRQAKVVRDRVVRLEFSDASSGEYDVGELIAKDTKMVRPLRDPAFFSRVFVELGALCWPNGFELSGESLYRKLKARGELKRVDAA